MEDSREHHPDPQHVVGSMPPAAAVHCCCRSKPIAEQRYDDVYYDSREAGAYGLVRPEILLVASHSSSSSSEMLASTQVRMPDFLEEPRVKFMHAINAAVLTQDYKLVGRLITARQQHLLAEEEEEDHNDNDDDHARVFESSKQVQRLMQVAVEFGDWKTLTRLLLVKLGGGRAGGGGKRKRPRLATWLVKDRQLVEASRRSAALGLHATHRQVAAQHMCYLLLCSARIRDHHQHDRSSCCFADSDTTVHDVCTFCSKDDLVALANAWLEFSNIEVGGDGGGMTAHEFCELRSLHERAPGSYEFAEDEAFPPDEEAERAQVIAKSYDTPLRRKGDAHDESALWSDAPSPSDGSECWAQFYAQRVAPNALNYHFANLVELASLHQATHCATFLQGLQSGRLV